MVRSFARIAALALGATLTLAVAGDAAPATDEVLLEELIVRAPVQPLDRSLILLRALTNSLPCLGCEDPQPAERPAREVSLLEFLLLPAQPIAQDRAATVATSVRYQDFGPDLGQR